MKKTRIQFIGFTPEQLPEQNEDEEFRMRRIFRFSIVHPKIRILERKSSLAKSTQPPPSDSYSNWEALSILDSNIVFLNDIDLDPNWPRAMGGGRLGFPTDLQQDLPSFLSGGQIFCAFLGNSNWQLFNTVYGGWVQILAKKGEKAIPTPGHWLSETLQNKEYGFGWRCIIEKGPHLTFGEMLRQAAISMGAKPLDEVFEVAATTSSGQCISCVLHLGNGKLILLPSPANIGSKLLRDLLNKIETKYFTEATTTQKAVEPDWLGKYPVEGQSRIREENWSLLGSIMSNISRFQELERDKEILWKDGKDLVVAVKRVFEKMGIKAVEKEGQGLHDLEISYHDFLGICEIKGLERQAKVEHVRQLLDHHGRVSGEHPDAKGIFIVNHFKNTDPASRGLGYSEEATNLATTNKFCLLTTLDLFNFYNEFLKRTPVEDLIRRIAETVGTFTKPTR